MASLITFSGLASGIDSSSLIKAILDSEREVRVKPYHDQITAITDTNSALSSLQLKLDALKTAANKFRLVSGGALSKVAASSDETKVSATASNGATNATYSVSVGQLARAATFSFDDRFADGGSAINSSINDGAAEADRTVTLTVGTGAEQESIDVVLTSTTTASQLTAQINASSEKAQASLVNVGTSSSPSYAIVINSLNQGSEKGEIAVTVGSEITTAGGGVFNASTLSQAQDAQFTVSGIAGTITRQSNNVTDVISGVTLNLNDIGNATLVIGEDTTTSIETVQEFVDAYNEVVNFIADQNKVTRDQEDEDGMNIFGPLAKSSVDENALSALRSALSSASLTSGTVRSLADLGLTTQRDGTLKFDTTTFSSAALSDPANAKTVLQNLGETLASVDGSIAQFTRFGGLIDVQETSNTSQIDALNKRIADVEKILAREEETLVARFARLESLMGKLNSQQNSLTSLIGAGSS